MIFFGVPLSPIRNGIHKYPRQMIHRKQGWYFVFGRGMVGQRIVRKVMAGAHIQMTPEDDPTSCTGSRMVAG